MKSVTDRILTLPLAAAAGGLVAAAAAVFLVTALFGLFNPRDTSQPEGAVVAAALRLAGGEPLYPDLHRGPYVTAMYGPFLYLVLGGVVRAAGAGVGGAYLAGRLLALGSALACALLVSLLAGRCGASRPARLLAGGLFLASPLILPVAYSTRSDLPALALALAGLLLFMRLAGPDGARPRPIALLAAVPLVAAIFTKQTAVAAPAAIVLWLLLRRRPWRALAMAAAVALPAAAILALLVRATGGLAALHLIEVPAASPLSLLGRPGAGLVSFLTAAALPLILAAPALARPLRGGAGAGLALCYAGAALAASLAASAKLGSDAYYFIEPLAATLVLSAAGLTRLLEEGRTLADRAALPVAGAFLVLLAASMGNTARVGEYRYASNAAAVGVAAAAPGDVLIEDENVALRSGKPVTMMDPFAFAYLERRGLWDAGPLNRRIRERQFGVIILRAPVEDPSHYQGETYWPAATLAAIAGAYAAEPARVDGYVVYRPRPLTAALARGGGAS